MKEVTLLRRVYDVHTVHNLTFYVVRASYIWYVKSCDVGLFFQATANHEAQQRSHHAWDPTVLPAIPN